MTLVEVVVCMALFGLFLIISSGMLGHAFRYYRYEKTPERLKAEARLSMQHMSKSIRCCRQLEEPTYMELVTKDQHRIILEEDTILRTRIVGFFIQNGCLVEQFYKIPYRGLGQGAPVVLCHKVSSLLFRIENPDYPTLVTIEMQVQTGTSPTQYTTSVNFRSAQ